MIKLAVAFALALTGIALAGGPLPFGERQRIVAEFEDKFSQLIGTQVMVLSDHLYADGLDCVVARIQGKKYRLVLPSGDGGNMNASAKQWADAGCQKPGYQLLR